MADDGNIDSISNMPQEVIEKILTFLTAREAVRTSVLSRTWRYKWTSIPILNFWEGCGTALNLGINHCLDLHQGPIHKFAVRVGTLMPLRHEIDQWMCLVLKPDLEELKVGVWGSDDYIFPSHLLFNCKKLRRLELSGCKLNVPPTFEGFQNLKIFQLSTMTVDSNIGRLISKSPLLERLTLWSFNCSNETIAISAPKVKYFTLQGQFKTIYLENASVLVDMIIDPFGIPMEGNLIKLLVAAPNLERLTIHYFTKVLIYFINAQHFNAQAFIC